MIRLEAVLRMELTKKRSILFASSCDLSLIASEELMFRKILIAIVGEIPFRMGERWEIVEVQ